MNLERPGSQQALVERTSSRRTTLLGRNESRGQLERPGSQQALVDDERRQRRMLHTDSEQALIDGERFARARGGLHERASAVRRRRTSPGAGDRS